MHYVISTSPSGRRRKANIITGDERNVTRELAKILQQKTCVGMSEHIITAGYPKNTASIEIVFQNVQT